MEQLSRWVVFSDMQVTSELHLQDQRVKSRDWQQLSIGKGFLADLS